MAKDIQGETIFEAHGHVCGYYSDFTSFMLSDGQPGCGHRWTHGPMDQDISDEANEEAHTCPNCGAKPWYDIHYRTRTDGGFFPMTDKARDRIAAVHDNLNMINFPE